jgi:hypothetical protein
MSLKRKSLFGAVVIGGAALLAAYPNVVRGYYLDIYPTDPAKQQALELCFLQDHRFNRLDANERESCYRHALLPIQSAAASMDDLPPPNAVDLQRAAAQGSLPRNDVRRAEQTQSALNHSSQ